MNFRYSHSLYKLFLALILLVTTVFTPAFADANKLPTPLTGRALRQKAEGVKLYSLNQKPLGNREPLLLVHGLLAEKYPLYRWKNVVEHLREHEAFKSKYKVYLVRYDTYNGMQELEKGVSGAIVKLHKMCRQPISVLTLSLGGNLVFAGMEDKEVNSSIKRVISMASMFQGSPLFVTDWSYQSLITNHKTPWVRFDKLFCYKAYFKSHQNLLQDIGWSNFDQKKPEQLADSGGFIWSKFRVRVPVSSPGGAEAYSKEAAQKFTLYGGYLENEYVLDKKRGFWKKLFSAPITFVKDTVPQHIGREHPVLKMLNQHIAVYPVTDDSGNISNRSYIYNDGIAPVSSSLVLPGARISVEPDSIDSLKNLPKTTSIKKARLFSRCDHLSFIDGFHQGKNSLVSDKLNPKEKPKKVFDWLLYDLLASH